MIEPYQKDERLLADIAAADSSRDVQIWWLGQSGFLVKWKGRFLLFDPYLSDSLTRKYAQTDKPHTRMTKLAVDPSRLGFVDLVTSSHNHTDHLDGETLQAILGANPDVRVLVPAANRQFAADRLAVAANRLDAIDVGQTFQAAGFTVEAIPAAHEQLQRDDQGRYCFLGYVVKCGDWTLYHSGDTILYDGLVERLREWRIDVAMLPINGSLPARRVAGNLWGREAVWLAQQAGIRTILPCHFEMFAFNTVSTEELVESARQVGQNYCVLQCGERWNSSDLPR